MLLTAHAAQVMTEYHQFSVGTPLLPELIHGQHPEVNLALFGGEVVRVNVGVRYGPVNVRMEVHDRAPQHADEGWEDVAEGDLAYDCDEGLAVHDFDMCQVLPADEAEKLTPAGRHRYRIRIHARGKAIKYDGAIFGEPVEDYLLQLWPVAAAADAVQLKNLSGR